MHFRAVDFFLWCEDTGFAHWIKGSKWVFPIVETLHIIGLTVLLGTVIVVDLRLLGFGMRRQSAAQLAREVAPWSWVALVGMLGTGAMLFMSEAVRLYSSSPFFYKMGFLFLAIVLHCTLHRKAILDAEESAWRRRLAASLSLACWLGVAFAGRVIAFTGDRFR